MDESERNSYTLGDIAGRYGGEVLGDRMVRIHRVATLENADAGALAFITSSRYLPQLKATRASAVLVGSVMRDATALPRIVCEDPYAYFAHVSGLFNPPRAAVPGIHPSAVVDASAVIADDAEIGPQAVLGRGVQIGPRSIIGAGCIIGDGARIGESVRLHAQVTIYEQCMIGDRVIIHSGAVIGADGFGIASEAGRWIKIPQIGRVVIGDDVEIGANTTVDRGALDDTVIEEGVKLDNQIQVGHNVRIGAHTAIAACAGIAGSARIGRHCRIGGAAGIAGHITIVDGVEISAHTVITKSIDKAGVYSGVYPFEPNREWRRTAVELRRLRDLAERLRALEQGTTTRGRSKP